MYSTKPLLSVFTKMACGSLILCSSIQPRRSLELLIPRFQLLLHPSTVGPFPPSLHPWSLLTAAARRRCHRHGAVGAATTAGAATSPFCSQQQQQSLCFPSLAIIEARGSLLLTCSYHRGTERGGGGAGGGGGGGSMVAKEAAFIAAAGRKKS